MIDYNSLSSKEKIVSGLFIFWFFLSMILLFIPGNIFFTLFIFGQYFFMFGLVLLYKKIYLPGIIFYLISLGLLLFCVANTSFIDIKYLNAKLSEINIIITDDTIIFSSVIMIILSLVSLIFYYVAGNKKIFFILFILFNIISILLMFLF